jgi:acyl-CoA thioester hydrolase
MGTDDELDITHGVVVPKADRPQKSPTLCLVVETQCRYHSSIAFPDIVHVGLRVAKLGTSSVRYELGIFRNDEAIASAEGHFVHVYVDRETNRPVPIPASVVTELTKLKMSE